MKWQVLAPVLLALSACASQPALVKSTQSGLPEARFRQTTTKYVRDKLALACASTGSIVQSSDYSIVCSRRNDSGRGFMAQALLGNACSDTPMEKLEFTTVQAGADVFVTARGWMEIKKCFGDIQRVEYDRNNNFRNEVQAGLDQGVEKHDATLAGNPIGEPAQATAVQDTSGPTTTGAPQIQGDLQTRELDPAKRCDACRHIGKSP